MNAGDKEKYLRQAASLKNGTARQMEIAQSLQVLVAEVERLQVDKERLLDDATDRISYTEYVLSSGAWAITPRHMLPVSYRDWVAAGKPEEVNTKAVSA